MRADARDLGVEDGTYYALHIRRGDFQFKDVKIGAPEIFTNIGGLDLLPREA